MSGGSYGGKSQLGFVGSIEESLVEVSVSSGGLSWTNRGWEDGGLQVIHSFGRVLLFAFPATVGSSDWVARHRSTEGCPGLSM